MNKCGWWGNHAKNVNWSRGLVEDLKSIPICELFYRITFDIIGLLPKTMMATNTFWWLLTIIPNGSSQSDM
jgi:hypothetical protein